MSIVSTNSVNFLKMECLHGPHLGKFYLFEESNKRWAGLRAYVKNRKEPFEHAKYFCIVNLDDNLKWQFGSYSDEPSSDNLNIPEVVLDIHTDKVYILKCQLHDFNHETEQ